MNTIKNLAVALALVSSAITASATTITASGGNDLLASFAANYTFGQTFKAVDDNLNSFSFSLTNGKNTTTFKSYVYAWDGQKATGAALYTSDIMNYSTSATQKFTFDTGNLALVEGMQYVAFLSAREVYEPSPKDATMLGRYTGVDTYTDGQFVSMQGGRNFSDLSTQPWRVTAWDTDFSATFSDAATGNTVPEPGSFALMGLGLFALAALRKRKA